MRKPIAAVALLLGLPLAGCVLAIGNSPDDEGADGKRLKAIEKRLEALEAKCGACMPAGAVMLEGGGIVREGGDASVIISGPDGKSHVVKLGKSDMKVEWIQEDLKEGDEEDEAKEKK